MRFVTLISFCIAAVLCDASLAQTTRPGGELVLLEVEIPRGCSVEDQTVVPRDLEIPTSRPIVWAPRGTTSLAIKRQVTSSEPDPLIGQLRQVTDGDKEGGEGSYVTLGPGLQWIQIDLGAEYPIYAIALWHRPGVRKEFYKCVVVQASSDPQSKKDVATLFNNDREGLARLGRGTDRQYGETRFGKVVDAKGLRSRYVRLWSNGNNQDDLNEYTEVEVYGLPR